MSNGYITDCTYIASDLYENDPYQNKRSQNKNNKNGITWNCPSKPSYLPYSDYHSTIPDHLSTSSTAIGTTTTTMNNNTIDKNNKMEILDDHDHSFYFEEDKNDHHRAISMMKMINERQLQEQLRQDSLLTTITTTTSTLPMINHNPCLRSALTTLSLSEELRKQKEQNETIDWFSFFFLCGCFKKKEKRKKKNKNKKGNWKQSRYCTWKWICLWVILFFLIIGSILIFFCWPRLPYITLANIADPFGQESADWGPPDHPFYKTNWQLNLTLNNQPNFIPLNIIQMDLNLNMHFSTNLSLFNTSSTSSSYIDKNSSTTTNNNMNNNFNNHITNITNNMNDNNYKNNPFIYSLAYTTLPSITLSKNETKTLNALFQIDYAASTSNLSDPIFAQLYNACGPHLINSPPALNISLQITFHLLHYLWSSTVNVFPMGGSGLICPTD